MASMGYDKATVVALMSLVDEQKEKLKEADYVKMCNAIRDLHGHFDIKAASGPRPPSPREQAPHPSIAPHFTDIQWAEMCVEGLRRSILIGEGRQTVVVNSHRQLVVEELTQLSIRGPRGGVRVMSTTEIHRAEDALIGSGLVQDHTHFEALAMVKSREEKDRFLRQQRVSLNMARTRLEVLRRVG
jgi:hypothetical protein